MVQTYSRRVFVVGGLASTTVLATGHRSLLAQAISGSIDSSALQPGEFVWEPQLSPDGPVVFIVSLPDQLVHVYRNGIEIGVSTCSTGKPGHRTPTGVFVILQKDKHHHSSTYNNAPMPNMQRLTWGGIALHAGNLPGYPASHGCIRLPRMFSELIFDITHLGIPVIIADGKSQPAEIVHPGLMLPADAERQASEAMLEAARKSHHPADATIEHYDVASLVISAADREASLLMDGVVVWQSPIDVVRPEQPLGHHVYTLIGRSDDGRSLRWLVHSLTGDRIIDSGQSPTLTRIHLLRWQEAEALFASMNPGSTLVVTDQSASEDTRTGTDFIIIRDDEPDA